MALPALCGQGFFFMWKIKIMKKLILALVLMVVPSLAFAQSSQRNPCYYSAPGSNGCIPVTATTPLPVNATVNASISGFAPATYGTPIAVTSANSTGTLPAGAVVVATNVGTTNGAYCKLGAASDTTGQYISPGGGWFAFTVGASTQLSCVTSTSTTTVNTIGGAGLPTGTGGGSGGSGGGGAVTIADAADVTQGAKADAPCGTDTGTCSVAALVKRTNQNITTLNATAGTATPAGTNTIGSVKFTDGTNTSQIDPCEANAQTSTPISITTATTTRIIAPVAAKKTYICYMFLTSAAADNIGIVEGTGGTCGTGTAGVIGGTTAANGPNFSANGGFALSAGGKVAAAVTAGTNVDFCLITSAATPLAGVVKWVQQ